MKYWHIYLTIGICFFVIGFVTTLSKAEQSKPKEIYRGDGIKIIRVSTWCNTFYIAYGDDGKPFSIATP